MRSSSASLKAWLGKAADNYHRSLLLDSEVRDYLLRRGIKPGAINNYRLGLVSEPDPMHEPFRGRLSIPFITPTGVVHLRFRCLEDHDCKEIEFHGKYEGPPGESTHLYNVQALHDADICVGICEGELDALVASNAGFPCVGVPGAQSWKPFYYRLFADFEKVVILGDGDPAGRKFTAKLTQEIPDAVARLMPPGQDVSEFITENGKKAFLRWANE